VSLIANSSTDQDGAKRRVRAFDSEHLTTAFRRGLAEAGYVEGKNLAIEYHFVMKPKFLSQAAVDLVQRNVNVIAALTPGSVDAARNATTSIPIVALDLLGRGRVVSSLTT
jgi:hypothetical protein